MNGLSNPVKRQKLSEWKRKISSRYKLSLLAQMVVCLQCMRPRFDPWVRKIPWRRAWWPI